MHKKNTKNKQKIRIIQIRIYISCDSNQNHEKNPGFSNDFFFGFDSDPFKKYLGFSNDFYLFGLDPFKKSWIFSVKMFIIFEFLYLKFNFILLFLKKKKICEQLMTRCLAPDCQMGGLGCDNMTVVLICFLNGEPYEKLAERCSLATNNNNNENNQQQQLRRNENNDNDDDN